jgi:hypothetical protein
MKLNASETGMSGLMVMGGLLIRCLTNILASFKLSTFGIESILPGFSLIWKWVDLFALRENAA